MDVKTNQAEGRALGKSQVLKCGMCSEMQGIYPEEYRDKIRR